MVCLQETKMGLINRAMIRSLWSGQHVDWSYLGSCGASGGVSLLVCQISLFGRLLVFMVLIYSKTGGFYGRNFVA